MYVEKPEVEYVTANIISCSIPSPTDLYYVKGIFSEDAVLSNDWWVIHRQPSFVDSFGSMHYLTPIDSQVKGVRLLVNYQSDRINLGDEIIINNLLFRAISNDYLLSLTVAGFSSYDNIEDVIDKWMSAFKKYPQNNGAASVPVIRIIKKSYCEIDAYVISLPFEDTLNLPISKLKTGIPYWSRVRNDEFSAWYINDAGIPVSMDMTKKLNICPVIALGGDTFRNDSYFWKRPMFIFKGKIFRLINKTEALCLNPIGYSCYSTALMPIRNERDSIRVQEEHLFYHSSEAYQVISDWAGNNLAV